MIYMFLSNNPSSEDINSSNLSCLFCRHLLFSVNFERLFVCLVVFFLLCCLFVFNFPSQLRLIRTVPPLRHAGKARDLSHNS